MHSCSAYIPKCTASSIELLLQSWAWLESLPRGSSCAQACVLFIFGGHPISIRQPWVLNMAHLWGSTLCFESDNLHPMACIATQVQTICGTCNSRKWVMRQWSTDPPSLVVNVLSPAYEYLENKHWQEAFGVQKHTKTPSPEEKYKNISKLNALQGRRIRITKFSAPICMCMAYAKIMHYIHRVVAENRHEEKLTRNPCTPVYHRYEMVGFRLALSLLATASTAMRFQRAPSLMDPFFTVRKRPYACSYANSNPVD